MNEFFKSEMVRGNIQEMAAMQEFCMKSMVAFPVLTPEKKLDYFNVLMSLIEKQKIFYARLTLSDDEEAVSMAASMKDAAVLLGAEPGDDLNEMFDSLLVRVKAMIDQLEAEEG